MPASNITDHNGKCFHALIQQFLQIINIFNSAETQTKGSDFAVWKIGFRWFRILGRSGIIEMCYPGPIHHLIFRLQTTERMVKMPASNFRNHSRYCYYVPIQLFYQAISIFSNAGTVVVEQYNFRVWKIGFPPDLRGDGLHLLLWRTILGLPRRHLPIPASTPLGNHKNTRFKL